MRCVIPERRFNRLPASLSIIGQSEKMFFNWQKSCVLVMRHRLNRSCVPLVFVDLFPPASSRLSLDLFFFEQYKTYCKNRLFFPPHAKEKINYVDRAMGVDPSLLNVHKNTNEKCQQWKRNLWGLTVFIFTWNTQPHTNTQSIFYIYKDKDKRAKREKHTWVDSPGWKKSIKRSCVWSSRPKLVSVNLPSIYYVFYSLRLLLGRTHIQCHSKLSNPFGHPCDDSSCGHRSITALS